MTASILFLADLNGEWGKDYTSKRDWFKLDQYTQVLIAFSGYGTRSGLMRNEQHDCRIWMMTNLEGQVIISDFTRHDNYLSFYFLLQSDLMLFKLKWGDKVLEWQPDR